MERSDIEQANHERTRIDDGLRIGQHQLSDNFNDLGAALFAAFPEATGQAMDLDILLALVASAVAAAPSAVAKSATSAGDRQRRPRRG